MIFLKIFYLDGIYLDKSIKKCYLILFEKVKLKDDVTV